MDANSHQPVPASNAYVVNLINSNPTIVTEITDLGYNARQRGLAISENPYIVDAPHGWWKNGWLSADSTL